MSRFPKNPPDVPPLVSAIIGRCTDRERQHIGQMAALAGMTVSQFTRMAVLRYCAAIQEVASDRTDVDTLVRESVAAIEAERAKVSDE